jgi:hypothetical protein
MDNQQIFELVVGVLIPAAVGLVVGLALRFGGVRDGAAAPRLLWLAAAGIAAAYAAAQWRINGLPSWPPHGSEARIFWLVVGTGVVGAVLGAALPRRLAGPVLAVLAAVAAGPAVLWPAMRSGPGTEQVLWASGAGVAVAAMAALTLLVEHRGGARTAAILLAGTGAAAAGAIAASHSLKLAQFAMAGAAAVLCAGLPARSGTKVWLGPGLAVGACIIGAAMLGAVAYADLPWYAALVIAAAPVAGVLVGGLAGSADRPRRRAAITIAAAALVAAAGVGAAAVVNMKAGSGGDSAYDYDYGY